MTNLSQLPPQRVGTIDGIHASPELVKRLHALGFKAGQQLQVIRRAPFAGPMHVRIGTTDVVIRRADARAIALMPELLISA